MVARVSQTLSTEQRSEVREIARAEVASLCGLVLRRLQEQPAVVEPGQLDDVTAATQIASIFGEALRDFSSETSEPGS